MGPSENFFKVSGRSFRASAIAPFLRCRSRTPAAALQSLVQKGIGKQKNLSAHHQYFRKKIKKDKYFVIIKKTKKIGYGGFEPPTPNSRS